MADNDSKKPKQRHRLLVNPQELGLTARIKTALLQQDMGITQRIKRAVEKTQDKEGFFEMKGLIFGAILLLLLFFIISAYFAFSSRTALVTIIYPDKQKTEATLEPIKVGFWGYSGKIDVTAYKRQVDYERIDVYGKDLLDHEYTVTKKDVPVENKHLLEPGDYTLSIEKNGYKKANVPMTVSDAKVTILVRLEPEIIPTRRLVLNIYDPLFEKPLDPDDVVIVGEKGKSIKNTLVRSGRYAVRVIKEGYEPKEVEIEVPDDGVVKEKITMQHKYRPVRFLINDGLWEDGKEPVLKGDDVVIKHQDKGQINYRDTLLPGHYTLEINRDGYKAVRQNVTVLPGETLDIRRVKMQPIPRQVLVQMNYDVIPPKDLKADKQYLIDLTSINKITIPITDELVAPGNFNVVVEKAGYKKFSNNIFIEPSSQPHIVKAHMVSVTKYMLWKIRSDFDVDPTPNPDEMVVDVDLRKKGYVEIVDLQRTLAAEKLEIEVPVFMETIPREVIPEITGDNIHGVITPDIITLARIIDGNEKETIDVATKDPFKAFKPGRYRLRIRKVGYEPVDKEIIIFPDDKRYVHKEELISIRRELVLDINSDYDPDIKAKPDSMLVNRKPAEEGIKLKPGTYTLVMEKRGYYPIEKIIDITPGSEPFIVKGQFLAKPRIVQYEILGEGFKVLANAKVNIGGTEIRNGDTVPPKKVYTFRIEHEGFEILTFDRPIEPSEDPYILNETLKPKLRPVIIHVTASFPKGLELMPLDTCTIGNEAVLKESNLKPAVYEMVLGKTGYETIAEKIDIQPSEEPFRIIKLMQPKERILNVDLKFDVPAENNSFARTVRLKGETIAFDKIVNSGDKINPHNYRLEVSADGYGTISEVITIDPAETPYLLRKELVALPRTVIFRVTSDYPLNPNLQDFKIVLDSTPVETIAKVKPGNHALGIEKSGYHSITDEIKILAGTQDVVIQKQLITMPRVVRAQISDIENNKPITPDVITLDDSPVTGTSVFKPKRYRLVIKAQGYATLTEDVILEPGVTEYVIERQLSPSERLVQTEIKGDYTNDWLVPQELTLNGEAVVAGQSRVRPLGYDLVIYVPGYERLKTRIQVAPSQEDYIIRQSLVSKKRKLIFDISDSLDNSIKIIPNKVSFNGKEVREGEEVKPGQYQVQLDKEGYDPSTTGIQIEPSEEAYTLKMTMAPRARRLDLQVDSDYRPGLMMDLDQVLVDNKPFFSTDVVQPGERNITLKKAGYEALSFTIRVEAGTTPHLIKKTMISKPRNVMVKVTHDYLVEGDKFKPELLALGQEDILPEVTFKPGSYELLIAHPGFAELREKIEVEPADRPLELSRHLIANRRRFISKLSYDIPPPVELRAPIIRIRSLQDNDYRIIKDGDLLIPGEYQVQIEKEAYELYNGRAFIKPDDRQYIHEALLEAKYVQIRIDIQYDVPPSEEVKNLGDYQVTFVDANGIGRSVQDGNSIKPGVSTLEVDRPGYIFRAKKKKLNILPSEQPYWIRETLNAKPRVLSFGILDVANNRIIRADQVLINNEPATPQSEFNPGQKYNFIARFMQYKTVDSEVRIDPGEGPFSVKVDLVEYKEYTMEIGKKYHNMVMDNIQSRVEIYVDGELLEPHHMKFEDGFNTTKYTFYAPSGMRSIRVVSAFFFDESLVKNAFEFRDLRKIDVERLLEHVRSLAKNSQTSAFRRIRMLMNDKQDKYKIDALPQEDRQRIANFLYDLNQLSAEEQTTRKDVIARLLGNG